MLSKNLTETNEYQSAFEYLQTIPLLLDETYKNCWMVTQEARLDDIRSLPAKDIYEKWHCYTSLIGPELVDYPY